MDEQGPGDRIAAIALAASYLVLRYGVGVESWTWVAIAMAIPVVAWIGFVLARDPRDD